MRKFILAAALIASAVPTVAMADPPPWAPAHGRRDHDWRENRRYDWNRPDPRHGNRYYADRYYRDGRYYKERRLTRNDRIYRGNDGRYYCRRSDGTTGLIIGAVGGGLLGNALDNGRSSTLGTIIGAGAGALLGRSIDRGDVKCR
nr:glycine zipper 2TM domain-containing protein [Sphingomonas sp. Y57]